MKPTATPALSLFVLAATALVATAIDAGAQRRGSVANHVARAADADRSGDVTAAEWTGFLASVVEDGARGIDRKQFMARILLPTLDRNGDGVVQTVDLDRLFAARDRNRNAVLEADEIGGRGVIMDRIVLAAADGNGDGSIDNTEWSEFLTAAKAQSGVTIAVAQGWIAKGAAPSDADRTAMTPGVIVMTMDAELDPNRDGVVKRDDLQALFASLDGNSDGALSAAEMSARSAARNGGPGAGGGRGGSGRGGAITDADRARPALVPWQRNLDDALALCERTGKPLLICVNMDGETACEQFAWKYYRDPAFARLTEGFVPLVASPDRHSPVDHDDRGRRLVDPKFGRVVDGEHIDQEPVLFEKYFRGQRVAPRHLAVDKAGKILFDIYLTNDLESVARALQKHGVKAGATRSQDRSIGGLLGSPDAGDRDELEQRFVAGDVGIRTDLAAKALSSERKVQHPALLRLGLRDPESRVRSRAARTVAENLAKAPAELVQMALLEGFADPGTMELLVGAMQRLVASGTAEQKQVYAAKLRICSGLQTASGLMDSGRWRQKLAGVRVEIPPAPAASELDGLYARLDELEEQVRKEPANRELRVAQAATCLRAARIQMAQSKDPTFLLQDVRSCAAKATSDDKPNPAALAHLAVACHLLDEAETLDHAVRALEALGAAPDQAASPIAAEVLEVFAQRRTRELYAAMEKGTDYPVGFVSDIRAVYEVLLAHPAGTEKQAVAFADFAAGIQSPGLQWAALQGAVNRFWYSSDLHTRYRNFGLTELGAASLMASYDRFVAASQEGRPTRLWYAGLGALMGAERWVFQRRAGDGRAAYARSIALFTESLQLDPNFADSANHYICLAHAGIARLQLAAGEVAAAGTSMQAAISARPAAMGAKDGLGITPASTAGDVLRALDAGGLADPAQQLRQAMTRAGIGG